MIKWKLNEFEYAIQLLKAGNTFEQIAVILNKTKNSVRVKLNKAGYKYLDIYKLNISKNNCKTCGKEINKRLKFCSRSCSAKTNNLGVKRHGSKIKSKNCAFCNKPIDTYSKHCSIECMGLAKRNINIQRIKNGDITLPSPNYKNYLISIHGEKCMKCGWNEKHPITKKSPIELEHKDGNSENNNLDNLELLCPNCHSLTPTYKALNVGNGRYKRRERYQSGKSF